MPRIAIYARVSTTDQHPEIQLNALRAYAEARSRKVVEVYVDAGVSGAKLNRPALDRLRATSTANTRHFHPRPKTSRCGRRCEGQSP